MVKPVKKSEQQAGILGVNALDPQPAVFLVFVDILPGNEALCPGGRVCARPQERTPARIQNFDDTLQIRIYKNTCSFYRVYRLHPA